MTNIDNKLSPREKAVIWLLYWLISWVITIAFFYYLGRWVLRILVRG